MSFAVFAIGALHALPPFLAAATTQSRIVTVLVGGATVYVGGAYGPTIYAGIDVAFAVLGTVIGWIIVPESGSSARESSPTTYSPQLKKTEAPDSGSVIRTVSNTTSSLPAGKRVGPTPGSSAHVTPRKDGDLSRLFGVLSPPVSNPGGHFSLVSNDNNNDCH